MVWAWKVQDLVSAGADMHILEATWHAKINDKFGGDLDTIRVCARYIEHCLQALGVEVGKIHFQKAEELMDDLGYWETFINIAKNVTLARVKRAMSIMGRKVDEAESDYSKTLYPCIQVADIIYSGFKLCLGGTDQRRAHILARELAPKFGLDWKPIGIHTPLLIGLEGFSRMEVEGEEEDAMMDAKMSKSKPRTAIFIHDTPDEIRKKIRAAFCPPKQVEYNPVMEINRLLLFSRDNFTLHVEREEKFGGPVDFTSFDELKSAYSSGDLHPLDLKTATAEALIDLFGNVRRHFEKDNEAHELLKIMKKAVVTR
ncbi:MAG: tyrosine--tRNA ligase [Candidatus Freyarchaeota archaeon]